MTWVKLMDTITSHPKIVAAGPEAAWLYVGGLCYCSKHLTDGEIPTSALPLLGASKAPKRLADRLVDVGLWAKTADGWTVHDYTDVQRTRAQVEEDRAANRERVTRHRMKRARNAITSDPGNAVTNGVSNALVTDPDTDTDTDNPLAPTAPGCRTDPLFEAVTAVCGIKVEELGNGSARGALNRALAELRGSGADPGDVARRARTYRLVFPHAALTPTALAKHWPQLASNGAAATGPDPPRVTPPVYDPATDPTLGGRR